MDSEGSEVEYEEVYLPLEELNRRSRIEVDVHKSARLYLRSAEMLFKQAKIYHNEGSLQKAYELYMRYSILILEELPKHPDSSSPLLKSQVAVARNNCKEVLNRLELLKPVLVKKYQAQQSQKRSEDYSTSKSNSSESTLNSGGSKPTISSPLVPTPVDPNPREHLSAPKNSNTHSLKHDRAKSDPSSFTLKSTETIPSELSNKSSSSGSKSLPLPPAVPSKDIEEVDRSPSPSYGDLRKQWEQRNDNTNETGKKSLPGTPKKMSPSNTIAEKMSKLDIGPKVGEPISLNMDEKKSYKGAASSPIHVDILNLVETLRSSRSNNDQPSNESDLLTLLPSNKSPDNIKDQNQLSAKAEVKPIADSSIRNSSDNKGSTIKNIRAPSVYDYDREMQKFTDMFPDIGTSFGTPTKADYDILIKDKIDVPAFNERSGGSDTKGLGNRSENAPKTGSEGNESRVSGDGKTSQTQSRTPARVELNQSDPQMASKNSPRRQKEDTQLALGNAGSQTHRQPSPSDRAAPPSTRNSSLPRQPEQPPSERQYLSNQQVGSSQVHHNASGYPNSAYNHSKQQLPLPPNVKQLPVQPQYSSQHNNQSPPPSSSYPGAVSTNYNSYRPYQGNIPSAPPLFNLPTNGAAPMMQAPNQYHHQNSLQNKPLANAYPGVAPYGFPPNQQLPTQFMPYPQNFAAQQSLQAAPNIMQQYPQQSWNNHSRNVTYPPNSHFSHASAPALPPKPDQPKSPSVGNQQVPSVPAKPIKRRPLRAYLENGEPIRSMFVPFSVMTKFEMIARKNTERNLETCGILCGTLRHNILLVTTLLIPKQTSTSDTCTTTNEEEMFEYQDKNDLITLGWIHTHPTQTCFMSSVDLHTHCSYQLMLPEAIAIVLSPRHSPSYGVFRLTHPPGLDFITKCPEKGSFHPHPDHLKLYRDCAVNRHGASKDVHDVGHVVIEKDLALNLVDLR
ncbi:hypothetical protein BKA69DRAFT_1053510 [Paraphysoderma sedebokerense]|nr:hypothetical protein BKA69DRAFT_1053510 [Paraphysoderma sedebokerense]